MANPRENTNPLISDDYAFGREFYIHPHTGRTHVRAPAGGAGGGITSYADVPASEEQHVAFLKSESERMQAESEALQQRHEEARDHLAEKREEGDETETNNPITDETYGRPPEHARSLGDQASGPRNPADERDPIDKQARSVKESV